MRLEQPFTTRPLMGEPILPACIAGRTGDYDVVFIVRSSSCKGDNMIDVVGRKLTATPVAFLFLSLQLILNVLSGIVSDGISCACLASMISRITFQSVQEGIFPSSRKDALTMCLAVMSMSCPTLFQMAIVVGYFSGPNFFKMGNAVDTLIFDQLLLMLSVVLAMQLTLTLLTVGYPACILSMKVLWTQGKNLPTSCTALHSFFDRHFTFAKTLGRLLTTCLAVIMQSISHLAVVIKVLTGGWIDLLALCASFAAFWYRFGERRFPALLLNTCLTTGKYSIPSFASMKVLSCCGKDLLAYSALLLRGIRGYTIHMTKFLTLSSRQRMLLASLCHNIISSDYTTNPLCRLVYTANGGLA